MTRKSASRFSRHGSTCDIYSKDLILVNKSNIDAAVDYCYKIEANLGGTELFNAMATCLAMSTTAILITDGDTSDNLKLHDLCSRFDCLSVLGIGRGINRANIIDMAKRGGGTAKFNQTDSDIFENINSIFISTLTPSIQNPSTNWSSNAKNLMTRSPIVFNQPNNIYCIFEDNANDFELQNTALNLTMIDADIQHNRYLACLVAKRIIA